MLTAVPSPSFLSQTRIRNLWIIVNVATSQLLCWPGVCIHWGLGMESSNLEVVVLSQDHSTWISWLLPFLLQGLCLWHLFFTKFGCHLSCRERRNGGWRHDETVKGAHTHPPARLRTDSCACQCVWKTTALCGVRKRTWHQHFCVRDRRKLLPHYIGTETWGPGGKEGGNVTTKFEGNIVLIRKQENVFLGMILIVYVGGCNRYLKYWMWPLKYWIL